MLISETQSVQQETKILLKKALGLIPTEEEYVKDVEPVKLKRECFPEGMKPTNFKPDEIVLDDQPVNTQTKPMFIHDDDIGDNIDNTANNIDVYDVDVQMFEQHEKNQAQEGQKDEGEKKDEEPPIENQSVDTQPPPKKDNNEEKQEEEKNEEIEKEKEEEKTENKEGTKENKAENTEPIVTPLSLDFKKKVVDEEDDDDALSIQGPLDMDKLSSTKLMEIATAMQSQAKKKSMKEQQKEAETIRSVVDILSSLLDLKSTERGG